MEHQVKLINTNLAGLINSCQENVEFRLPSATWTRFLNEGIMDLYPYLFIEAEATLTKPDEQEYFELPDDVKQLYLVGSVGNEFRNWDIASDKTLDYTYANADSNKTYRVFNNKLYLNGYDENTISIKYFRKPRMLELINKDRKEDEYKIDVPNEFIEPVMLYACAKAMQAEDETARYNIFMGEYRRKKDWLNKYVNRYRPERKLYWSVRR